VAFHADAVGVVGGRGGVGVETVLGSGVGLASSIAERVAVVGVTTGARGTKSRKSGSSRTYAQIKENRATAIVITRVIAINKPD
jgi:hypothetical protein